MPWSLPEVPAVGSRPQERKIPALAYIAIVKGISSIMDSASFHI